MVVAEEPGIGLGAALAGLDSVDPGAGWAAPPAWPRPEMAGSSLSGENRKDRT